MKHTKESVIAYFDYLIGILEKAKEPFAEFYTRPENEDLIVPRFLNFDYSKGHKDFDDETGELDYSEPDLLYWGLYSPHEMHSFNIETGEIDFDELQFEEGESNIGDV